MGEWLAVLPSVIAGLLLVGVIALALSKAILDGPDPEGWWNFIPGMVFYATVWLIPILGLAWLVRELASFPVARRRSGRGSG